MSSFVGNDDEMVNRYPTDEQTEALIRGEDPGDPALTEVAGVVASIRALGEQPLVADVTSRHVALIAAEVAVSPRPASEPDASPKRTRRQIVLNTLLSSVLAKALAATVAVAAAGTGVGVVADSSVPGDALYGLDRAMERIGIANGAAAERIDEARSLIDVDLPTAVETAAEATPSDNQADNSEAVTALHEAALRVGEPAEGEQSALTREQVATLLEAIAAQLENEEGFDNQAIAEQARRIRPDVELPEQITPVEVPPVSVTSATTVPTTPDEVPPAGRTSTDAPPEAVPPTSVPTETP